MNKQMIEMQIRGKQADLKDMKWMRKHFIDRRAEMRDRKAPTAILSRYDNDLVDVNRKIELLQSEIGDLEDQLLARV